MLVTKGGTTVKIATIKRTGECAKMDLIKLNYDLAKRNPLVMIF